MCGQLRGATSAPQSSYGTRKNSDKQTNNQTLRDIADRFEAMVKRGHESCRDGYRRQWALREPRRPVLKVLRPCSEAGRSAVADSFRTLLPILPHPFLAPSEVRFVRQRHIGVLSRVPLDVFGASHFRPVG